MTPHTAPWIILFAPLISAALILFFGSYSKKLSAGLAIGTTLLACALSWYLFFQPDAEGPNQFAWADLTAFGVQFQIVIGVTLDHLSKVMLLIVTSVASLVFIYSLGYMAKEEGYSRYFAGLSLFLFSMLGIVLADNFLMMFIFWELVGVSSYILIGHYYTRNSAAEASKQAFLVNRIGDFGFLLGILMLWVAVGSVMFSEINAGADIFKGHELYLGIALILVFCGTIGKSAQLPLHVWLPNSMEGPTPVSSLLHAATMVAAGVYMLARIFPLLLASEMAMLTIAWVGGITCFVAGLMGLQQDDIKRILAYSTISQLGYMVMAVGVSPSPDVPMFHLYTHAFFKCLLFLCAGSVIVGMHHEQNIWKMGALKNKMPLTFFCMLFGSLALVGFPGFSGFFSKDTIIAWALEDNLPLFWISSAAVFLTAAYTFRLFFVVFLGPPRSEAARTAHESPMVMIVPMVLLALAALGSGWPWIAKIFFDVPHPPSSILLHVATLGFLALGLGVAYWLYYRGPQKDPVVIPFFANRLYIDQGYAWGVRVIQGGFANLCAFADRWIVDGLIVQCTSKSVWVGGFVLRFLQFGNLQAYAFFFGGGVVVLLYILLTDAPEQFAAWLASLCALIISCFVSQ